MVAVPPGSTQVGVTLASIGIGLSDGDADDPGVACAPVATSGALASDVGATDGVEPAGAWSVGVPLAVAET